MTLVWNHHLVFRRGFRKKSTFIKHAMPSDCGTHVYVPGQNLDAHSGVAPIVCARLNEVCHSIPLWGPDFMSPIGESDFCTFNIMNCALASDCGTHVYVFGQHPDVRSGMAPIFVPA